MAAKSSTKTTAAKKPAAKSAKSTESAAAKTVAKETEAEKKAGADELVTPPEHAQTTETLDATEDVSDESVPDDVEIGARSADMDAPSNTHEKQFVLGPNPYVTGRNPYTEKDGYDHEPNKAATRQYMIDQGLWPTGAVEHKSTKRHPDGESWILTYTVEAIPANDAPEGSQTPRVVAPDTGDAEGARNYLPPERVDEHEKLDPLTGEPPTGDQTTD